jgi:hypothetical protein
MSFIGTVLGCLVTGISVFIAIRNINRSHHDLIKESFIKEVHIPEQRILNNNKHFPLVLEPTISGSTESFIQWIIHHRDLIDKKLLEHQVILFRNFRIPHAQAFNDMVEATGLEAMDYLGGAAVRKVITSRVLTANESPATEVIPFHHEMAQTPHPPTHVFFYSQVVAETNGQTPILSSTELYSRLAQEIPEFIAAIEQQGVKYVRVMYVITSS